FIPPPNDAYGRILDPCAGEGEIATTLGKLLNCETWGCELFPYRAEKAAVRTPKPVKMFPSLTAGSGLRMAPLKAG
ncbi:MAG: class I SAM-dependent methyltransferase, partial [Anaerolineales bacterium]|nr:class I SAM-dependent methyltransferase [Anaerolineales bacterium]